MPNTIPDTIDLKTEAQFLTDYAKDNFTDGKMRGGRKVSPWKMPRLSKRITECKVTRYVHNVSPRKIEISTPPGMPNFLLPCKEGQKFSKPLHIREITPDYASMGDYKLRAVEIDDINLSRAIVCPNCRTLKGRPCNDSSCRMRWGVFDSPNAVPTEEELAKARGFYLGTCSDMVKIADQLWENPKDRWQVTHSPIFRQCAKELKLVRPWCQAFMAQEDCSYCKQPVPKEAAKCPHAGCGAILNWEKARKGRIVSKAEYEEAVADGLVPGVAATKVPVQA